jgi:hypothetical protein
MMTSRRSASAILKGIIARQQADEQARASEINRVVEAGPPAASSITRKAWRDWHQYGFVVCPRRKMTCTNSDCGIGASCLAMRAVGLAGDGSSLERKDRPRCGAQNRQGQPCAVRVEPGKARCRFHGGLSTGPRTAEGKARIAAAQRRRWAQFRRWVGTRPIEKSNNQKLDKSK